MGHAPRENDRLTVADQTVGICSLSPVALCGRRWSIQDTGEEMLTRLKIGNPLEPQKDIFAVPRNRRSKDQPETPCKNGVGGPGATLSLLERRETY